VRNTVTKALIVGAGIAGDTLATLLARAGWAVTVVELAPALRSGGQTVDLRGDARSALEQLGLLDAAQQLLVAQRGIAWVDARGRRLAEMPVTAFDGQGFVSTEELLRTDLAQLLHRAAMQAGATHRFGDTVDEVRDVDGGAVVRFRSGATHEYDLVVGADGAHSRVRALRFGAEDQFRHPLGLAHAWYTLREGAGTPSLDGWFLVHNAPGKRAVEARPGHPGEQEIGFTFGATSLPPRGDAESRLALLHHVFGTVGWRTPELLAAASAAGDFTLDTYDQVRVPSWVAGRVVLLGDAAWCASPLSGLGTALALRGATALADALGSPPVQGTRLATALRSYEQTMRPAAEAAQRLIPGRVNMVAPRRRSGIAANAIAMRVLQWRILTPMIRRLGQQRGHGG
jgi:2-polyprenyl-6-methoxyphenol hydroxylase-like FAD-dependent oxidoreductase